MRNLICDPVEDLGLDSNVKKWPGIISVKIVHEKLLILILIIMIIIIIVEGGNLRG